MSVWSILIYLRKLLRGSREVYISNFPESDWLLGVKFK
jgi:hypothetical protein